MFNIHFLLHKNLTDNEVIKYLEKYNNSIYKLPDKCHNEEGHFHDFFDSDDKECLAIYYNKNNIITHVEIIEQIQYGLYD